MNPSEQPLAILGAGHLATALVRGLVRSGRSPDSILVAAPGAENRDRLAADFGVLAHRDNAAAVEPAQLVILAVRPPQVGQALAPLAGHMDGKLLVSTAAGLTCARFEHWLPGIGVVRAMPNLGIASCCGFTGLCCPPDLGDQARTAAENLFADLGHTAWVDETLMDAVTALAGSGPGFAFHFADALAEGGVSLGLKRDQARTMALSVFQACSGLLADDSNAADWQHRVASAGGTTEAGLQQLQAGGLTELTRNALAAARDRAAAIGSED